VGFSQFDVIITLVLYSTNFPCHPFSNAPELISKYYAELKVQSTKPKGGKRGRSSPHAVEDVVMKDGDDDGRPPPKKPKKETTAATSRTNKKKDNSRLSKSKSSGPLKFSSLNETADKDQDVTYTDPSDPQFKYDSMQQYWHVPDWTPLIEEILTVDYANDSQSTVVYFMKLQVYLSLPWEPALTV
jgi:hypothetical protein